MESLEKVLLKLEGHVWMFERVALLLQQSQHLRMQSLLEMLKLGL